MIMITQQQAQQILEIKQKIQDNPKLLEKKKKFYDWLNIQFCDYGTATKQGNYVFPVINYNPKLKNLEMWDVEGEPFKNYNGEPNTRTKVNSETGFEVDNLPKEKAFAIICEVISSLIRNNYNFFVWYAKGQRSPHIRIYDFEQLQELTPPQRYKAQFEFWREQTPFFIQYADRGIWIDDHFLQMEYAPHWKYGTPFELLFEYKPDINQKKEYPTPLLFFDGGIKFNPDKKTGTIAYAYVLFTNKGEVISENCFIEKNKTTPQAEYKALIQGLEEIKKQGLDKVQIYGDSQLIINQILGKYRCDSPELKELHKKAISLLGNNKIQWIPREKNGYADFLVDKKLKPFRFVKKRKTKIEKPKCSKHNDLNILKYKTTGGDWFCPICMN